MLGLPAQRLDEYCPCQRFIITIDIPGCIGTDTIPVAARLNVLNHLERHSGHCGALPRAEDVPFPGGRVVPC